MVPRKTSALINERTDLVALVGEYVKLVRRGDGLVGRCPFHENTPRSTPTFQLNAKRTYFHCFTCKVSGGAIDFLMKIKGCSYVAAARALGERAGVEVVERFTD